MDEGTNRGDRVFKLKVKLSCGEVRNDRNTIIVYLDHVKTKRLSNTGRSGPHFGGHKVSTIFREAMIAIVQLGTRSLLREQWLPRSYPTIWRVMPTIYTRKNWNKRNHHVQRKGCFKKQTGRLVEKRADTCITTPFENCNIPSSLKESKQWLKPILPVCKNLLRVICNLFVCFNMLYLF